MSHPAPPTSPCTEGGEQTPTSGHPTRILVVDDDVTTLTFVSEALIQLGYHVEALGSPTQALDRFRSDPMSFDLVLTDFNMPELDGMQLSQNLLELRPSLPILLMTGDGLTLEGRDLFEKGFKALLKKPFSLMDLDRALLAALG